MFWLRKFQDKTQIHKESTISSVQNTESSLLRQICLSILYKEQTVNADLLF